VSNGVSPFVQFLKLSLAPRIPRIRCADHGPEVDSESTEVRPQIVRIRIASINPPAESELRSQDVLHRDGMDATDQLVDRLRMQVAAESLKLGREQHRIGMIDLLRRISPSRSGPADGGMSGLDLIQLNAPFRIPTLK
jgi:hypothetical protein